MNSQENIVKISYEVEQVAEYFYKLVKKSMADGDQDLAESYLRDLEGAAELVKRLENYLVGDAAKSFFRKLNETQAVCNLHS